LALRATWYKQIFPALAALVKRGLLGVPIIGVARAGWTEEQFVERARRSLEDHRILDEASFGRFASLLRFVDGDYGNPATFARLRKELGAATRPLHYLAIPPELFETVARALQTSGAADGARVVVEKLGELNRSLGTAAGWWEYDLAFNPWNPVANIAGCTSASLPLHWSPDGLPIGSLLTAGYGQEAALIRVCAQLEEAQPWGDCAPTISTRLGVAATESVDES
jgi:Asp-tRNA(Asn)/Glu-tRNA(Gln) amidotransferase A subunit family amidase